MYSAQNEFSKSNYRTWILSDSEDYGMILKSQLKGWIFTIKIIKFMSKTSRLSIDKWAKNVDILFK